MHLWILFHDYWYIQCCLFLAHHFTTLPRHLTSLPCHWQPCLVILRLTPASWQGKHKIFMNTLPCHLTTLPCRLTTLHRQLITLTCYFTRKVSQNGCRFFLSKLVIWRPYIVIRQACLVTWHVKVIFWGIVIISSQGHQNTSLWWTDDEAILCA